MQAGDSVDVTVAAVNEIGQGEPASASTSMPNAPETLMQLVMVDIDTTHATVEFVFGNDGGNSIKHATLSVSGLDDIMIEPTQTSQLIDGLDKGSSYVVTASVSNFVFTSEESSVEFTTLSEAGVPTDLVADAGSDTVTLTWTAPEDDGQSAITSFNLYMWEMVDGDYVSHGSRAFSEATATLTDLQPTSEWKFTVAAVNAVGEGR